MPLNLQNKWSKIISNIRYNNKINNKLKPWFCTYLHITPKFVGGRAARRVLILTNHKPDLLRFNLSSNTTCVAHSNLSLGLKDPCPLISRTLAPFWGLFQPVADSLSRRDFAKAAHTRVPTSWPQPTPCSGRWLNFLLKWGFFIVSWGLFSSNQ